MPSTCLAFAALLTLGLADDYCSLNCTDLRGNVVPHTACARRGASCGPAPACGDKFRQLPPTDEARAWFVHRHNEHRSRVARGGVRFRGRTLRAANMMKLQWDDELEYTARCWANACAEGRDVCRVTERFRADVGQNRFDWAVGEEETIDERAEVYRAVDTWYSEARFLNESLIKRYNNTEVAPQGAQVLWSRTTHIGCARVEYLVDEERRRTTICNYGPGGNVHGSAVFLVGEPCSKCGRRNCCDEQYDGLCVAKNGARGLAVGFAIATVFLTFLIM